MKKIIFIMMCFVCSAVYTQEQVFSVDDNGNISIKTKYIETYPVKKYENTSRMKGITLKSRYPYPPSD